MPIHPTAIVDRGAELDSSATVGAYAIIEPGVRIAAGVTIHPHAFVSRGTTLHENVQVHPFAVVGHEPQDLAWSGAPSYTEVGAGSILREGASVHRGTKPESVTRIGRKVFLMAGAHIGHNCDVGDEVILVNGALLAGYVEVGRKAFLGGGAMVHQFSRIGELAMVHGGARLTMDVPPFMMHGPQGMVGLNTIGLRRAGLTVEERNELRRVYHALYRSGRGFRDALERVAPSVQTAPGKRLIEFLQAPTRRGIAGYRGRGSSTNANPDSDE